MQMLGPRYNQRHSVIVQCQLLRSFFHQPLWKTLGKAQVEDPQLGPVKDALKGAVALSPSTHPG